jgi:hypothetical protein
MRETFSFFTQSSETADTMSRPKGEKCPDEKDHNSDSGMFHGAGRLFKS